jgi:hypothetical protein
VARRWASSGVHPSWKEARTRRHRASLFLSSLDCAPAIPLPKFLARASSSTDRRAPPVCRRPRRDAVSSVALAAVVPCRAAALSTFAQVRCACERTVQPPRRSEPPPPSGRTRVVQQYTRPEARAAARRTARAACVDRVVAWRQLTTDPSTWEAGTRRQLGKRAVETWTTPPTRRAAVLATAPAESDPEIPSTLGPLPSVGSGLCGRDRRGWGARTSPLSSRTQLTHPVLVRSSRI